MSLTAKYAALTQARARPPGHSEGDQHGGEERFRQMTGNPREGFFLVDPTLTRMYYVSPGCGELWGQSCERLYADPRSFIRAIHADDAERAIRTIAPRGLVTQCNVEYRVVQPDRSVRWVQTRTFPIRGARGEVDRFVGFAEDITDRRMTTEVIARQAKALERSNARLALLGEMTERLQTVHTVAEAALVVAGYAAQGHVGDGGAIYLSRESSDSLDLLAQWGAGSFAGNIGADECWALRRGQTYEPVGAGPALRCGHVQSASAPAAYVCLPIMVEGGAQGLLHIMLPGETAARANGVSRAGRAHDADDEMRFARRMGVQLGLALADFRVRETLRVEAMGDALTGLFNRRFLEASLAREFARAARERNSVAVAMVDVDGFKHFNDAHGHHGGDAALRQLARVLEASCRATDIACRYGGEEFAVIMPGVTSREITAWADRLLETLRGMSVVVDGRPLPPITVSIGIALHPEHGACVEAVIRAADQALYAAKAAGRDRYVLSVTRPVATGNGSAVPRRGAIAGGRVVGEAGARRTHPR